MTVKELMEKLATYPPGAIVATYVDFDYDNGGYMEAKTVDYTSVDFYKNIPINKGEYSYDYELKNVVILSPRY